MKKTGAWLTRYGLEQLPITHTFGIPGMQNLEIYDELDHSGKITPILVTHEESASFAADGLSRSSGNVGVCLVVPGAGVSNAFSGICEALLDGIPILVIAGGARSDTGKHYQLHQIDQQQLVSGAVKRSYRITRHDEIVPTLFEAFNIATSGCPGPVFIEIPVNIQILTGECGELPVYQTQAPAFPEPEAIHAATEIIKKANHPAIFAGWGCKNSVRELTRLAELLQAPVALTMQGYGVFPGTHPLHTGMGFGVSAVPAARNAFKDCDCLIAIATRFAEVATGSYGVEVPKNLIHMDIDPKVFDKNYPAAVRIVGDASVCMDNLIRTLEASGISWPENTAMKAQIKSNKEAYFKSWATTKFNGVNPAVFINALSEEMDGEDYILTDVGNHTFLMAEHFIVKKAGHFIAPSDFNCMGYAVPAALGVKLAHPASMVAAVVGDGGFLVTCMEILTAAANEAGIIYCVFHDGELAQISQTQKLPYNRKTCTVLPDYSPSGVSLATGAAYIEITSDNTILPSLRKARSIAAKGQPVIVDIFVDYTRKTAYTKGVIKTNFARLPLNAKIRLLAKGIKRRLPFPRP